VLLVEDDPRVASFVQRGLARLGFRTQVAGTGRAGLELALDGRAEVVILDLLLPELDGRAVLTELRRRGDRTPVLVLSACDGVAERVRLLDCGADDFLVKPFDFEELVARLRALTRRPAGQVSEVLEVGDLRVDLVRRSVQRGVREIQLTAREFALLEYLMRNAGRVVSKTMILSRVWDYSFDPRTNVVDVLVHRLREKIDRDFEPTLLHTRRGIGYVLEASTASGDR